MIAPGAIRRLCKHVLQPRTPPKMSVDDVVSTIVYHELQEGGTLADSGTKLHRNEMSNAAYAHRRQHMPSWLFDHIMVNTLVPLADKRRHPDCFYRGWRPVGVDGTQWSVTNTSTIAKQLTKAASRRLKAAFAKVRLVCATELGTHAPVAAVAAPASEGEQTLARRLWRRIPDGSLVIGDRLFGTACTLNEAVTEAEGRKVAFLVRIKNNIKVQVVRRLSDGSAIVQVPVREDRKVVKLIEVREIHAKGIALDGKRFELRLWTTLHDHKLYPADELAELYAMRWECELYYKELKLDVRGAPLLASHTLETALQEIAAVILGSAVIARMRVEAAERMEVPVRRVSFFKLLLATRGLWAAFEHAGAKLTKALKVQFWKQFVDNVRRTAILPERRNRSCPRVLRQPVSKWPRKINQKSYTGEVEINVVRVRCI
jgi:hypothetical protein